MSIKSLLLEMTKKMYNYKDELLLLLANILLVLLLLANILLVLLLLANILLGLTLLERKGHQLLSSQNLYLTCSYTLQSAR